MKFPSTAHDVWIPSLVSTKYPLYINLSWQPVHQLKLLPPARGGALFQCQGQGEDEDVIHTVGFETRQKRVIDAWIAGIFSGH
jgi:hypothetical protein